MNVQQYKQRLLDSQRKFAAQTDRDLKGGRAEAIDGPHDVGDQSVADVSVDAGFTNAELNSVILVQIEDALKRIEGGTYGRCVVDGELIDRKRLDAVPWAPYCLKHQDLLDAAGRERNWTL